MDESWGGNNNKNKAEGLAEAINRLLMELILRCSVGSDIKNRFYINVVGYTTDSRGNPKVQPAFAPPLNGKKLIPIKEVGVNPLRVEQRIRKQPDGSGGLVDTKVKFPIWINPVTEYGTPMCGAFEIAYNILNGWINMGNNRENFPPIVINITDGVSTDGNPLDIMKRITSLSTNDGNVLLFNLHISSSGNDPITFPSSMDKLTSEYAKTLYEGSSTLTPDMVESAKNDYGLNISTDSKGFVFNGDIVSIITALNIGSNPISKLR